MYSSIRPLLFHFDPETMHDRTMQAVTFTGAHPGLMRMVAGTCQYTDTRLQVACLGLSFPNPLGLAAGFDKDGRGVLTWEALGFGFCEVGSVTRFAQAGNPKPRLFRLVEDEAVINRFGFNNRGADAMVTQLKAQLPHKHNPLGINLGKSKVTPLAEAASDYLYSLKALWDYGDYFVVNVSSPNTTGLRDLQSRDHLNELLGVLVAFVKGRKPLLLKVAPDLSWPQLDDVLELTVAHQLSGLILTNTTISREGLRFDPNETGGLSGVPLRARAMACLQYVHERNVGVPLISVGGVSSAHEVYARLRTGASLVQLYTALVYQGPRLLYKLNKELLELLTHDGFSSVQEVMVEAQR